MTVNIGRHDEHGGVAVDDDVARQQADFGVAPAGAEVAELLIRKRFDRCGVERALPVLAGHEDAKFPDNRLAGTCWRGHENGVAFSQRLNGLSLEVVELVRQTCRELLDEFVGCH